MATTYEIRWSDGRSETTDTYDQAMERVRTEYPDAEIGHDGDLSEGGDRTLCWADEASSVNDAGARSIASIVAEG